jgi:hypothetical protein
MIDDMPRLKEAMEQMDAEDPTVAQAAKDRAAQTLSDAKLNFAKMAELIEQRRLLLRPRIVAGIKRMDQPGMLGDAAFRDTGSALRREGQSFRQIAEAIERTDRRANRVGPRGSERSLLSRALFSFRCYIPSGSSRSHSSPCCCSTPCAALFPPASKLWDISIALPPSATARVRRCRRWVLR